VARLQPVRGTHDIMGDRARAFSFIADTFGKIARRYGHQEIATPIFEFTEVFNRTLGETSDVVSKEMYVFEDRGGESLTLRPEYTAGIARAFISGGLQQQVPCKFYGHGPMFRYERPQKGRMRQFHQIDAEILGVAEPQADIELLAMAWDLLTALGMGKHIKLELNSLGDQESRDAYRTALVEYFSAHKDKLSEDSLKRLDKNPLRILDSKNEGDKELVKDAPVLQDYFNDASTAFFDEVKAGLDALGLAYTINPRLVRGLDYYAHTAFEFTTDQLGAQGTVLAGGRYDGLIEQMGGPATAGIGWAAGMERLAELVGENLIPADPRPVSIVPMGGAAQTVALKLCRDLRNDGFPVDMAYKGNVGKRMKRANKLDSAVVILMGDDELARNVVTIKDLDEGSQQEVPLEAISDHLMHYR